MKKILCLLMISCFVWSGCSSNAEPPVETTLEDEASELKITPEVSEPEPVKTDHPDFRNTKWGMTMEEVETSENGIFLEESESHLVYRVDVATYPASAMYEFENNSLVFGGYIFNIEHSNENLCIDDYNDLKNRFTTVYGEPIKSEESWIDDSYKDSPNDYGLAVSLGDLIYTTTWETDKSKIALILSGDNYEVRLGATYCPINYEYILNTNGI